ncbi:specificity protein phosphatase 15 [Seminavis robusta]|uniref:protein-tyrosine-phosphatase n=1 Tax=Seminavis robusta TaxID=568900 RepID=A0A9N8H636_9STRA|nr:specificity protein phosphatase 15 [Seminavis robusta]|eukprot:Sro133_g063160.1 specificity protein phosphatase 15 (295) ;mRNA; r:83739-84934
MSLIYTADSSITGGKRHSLYIGGRSDAKDRDKLRRWGVTHILNVTAAKDAGVKSGVPNFFEKDRSFTYHRVPVYDAPTSAADLLRHANDICDFCSKGLCHGSLLVHCNMGQSRSTTAALFFLIRKANMSLQGALEMIKRRRPAAEPIPAFHEILVQYEAQCDKERGKGDNTKKTKRSLSPTRNPHEEKKRPRVGPSIGPALPSAATTSIGPEMPPSSKAKAAIGPTMPPSKNESRIGPTMPESSSETETNDASSTIGPALPPSNASIGPAMPPSGSDTPKQSTTTNIGPSLPPS